MYNTHAESSNEAGKAQNFDKLPLEEKRKIGENVLSKLVSLLLDPKVWKARVSTKGGGCLLVSDLKQVATSARCWLMAGSVCKDWSSVGTQSGLLGNYVVT